MWDGDAHSTSCVIWDLPVGMAQALQDRGDPDPVGIVATATFSVKAPLGTELSYPSRAKLTECLRRRSTQSCRTGTCSLCLVWFHAPAHFWSPFSGYQKQALKTCPPTVGGRIFRHALRPGFRASFAAHTAGTEAGPLLTWSVCVSRPFLGQCLLPPGFSCLPGRRLAPVSAADSGAGVRGRCACRVFAQVLFLLRAPAGQAWSSPGR